MTFGLSGSPNLGLELEFEFELDWWDSLGLGLAMKAVRRWAPSVVIGSRVLGAGSTVKTGWTVGETVVD